MIICKCGHQNPLEGKFCNRCGRPLPETIAKAGGQGTQPIPNSELNPGTVLRDRYRILRLLGQGGFGRVYLAENTEKFNEKLIVKEFTPALQGTDALERSEKLFEREAATIYKLQHSQIPKFEGIFRAHKRLFLVQEFIEGQTYAELLEQRRPSGKYFSEAEILELFRQILPILSYLHSEDVIHRDISPDNIIRRQKDGLPILIDFGAVKEVAIKIATEISGLEVSSSQSTRIGKIGYAPDEQLGKGIVAPHSDLYGLAASALYLMTGKQPTELWDVHTAQWIWQKELNLSPKLTEALNRMLANVPKKRFQSAEEVRQFLDAPTNLQVGNSPNKPRKPWLLIAGIGVTAAVVAVSAIAFLPLFKPNPPRTLTLGILAIPLFPKEEYQPLADYLKTELGSKLKTDSFTIIIDPIDPQSTTSLLDAKNRLAEKKWDIAFTVNPMLSVAAKNSGYTFAARMWPGSQQVESVLFVRADSSIKSIADLTPDKTIALGQSNDAVTFYQPLYDLYGKTLTLDKRNSVPDIIKKVESAQADVGAGYLNSIQNNPKLRILGVSRAIPLSGVYLSPNLSQKEQDLIKETLLNAPPDLRKKTNYEQGLEPDYTNFVGITNRVNEILSCTNLDKNPVNLYCNQPLTFPTSPLPTNIIEGKVNGLFPVANDTYELTLQTQKNTYKVILPNQIVSQMSNVKSALELNGKIIQVIGVNPKEAPGTMVLEITQSDQIQVKN